MRIGLFGQFGSGNLGNDGSLEAMIGLLARAGVEADLVCICSGPAAIEATYRIPAIGITQAAPPAGPLAFINRLLFNLPRRLGTLARPFIAVKGLDAIIVPGTGILDDFYETPFGWPAVVLRWSLAARLRGVPVFFVSIGAGPARNRLSRAFLITAARLAACRSYRDELSRNFIAANGIDAADDVVNCDLAFSLPLPAPQPVRAGGPVTVGVGVMDYAGWKKAGSDSETIYAAYLEKIRTLVMRLTARGLKVRLLTGDAADERAVRGVLAAVQDAGGNLAANPIRSLGGLMEEIGRTDIVVATRYHNVVCALRMGRPTISLGYAEKNDEVLARVGLAAYCHHVETFDVDVVDRQVDIMLRERAALRPLIGKAVERFCAELDEQARAIACRLGSRSAGGVDVGRLPCSEERRDCVS